MSALDAGDSVTPGLRLVRQLGRGGMGSVWLAERTSGERVVVKFMDPVLAKDPTSIARFSREAASAASVHSPHVVQILEHGVTGDGQPYIVMELLEGRDLAQHLDDVGRMPLRDVTRVVTQIARALARTHALGIVHRDLKPENIFLCAVGGTEIFAKLLDFGLAKRDEELDTATKTGVTLGTPFYMSPEQIVNPKQADRTADLWALAVVAFEALTGRRPFEGDTVGAVAVALHQPHRPRPSQFVEGLPREIDVWFERAFAARAQDRFTDAIAMAEAFRAAAKGERSEERLVTPALPMDGTLHPALDGRSNSSRRLRLSMPQGALPRGEAEESGATAQPQPKSEVSPASDSARGGVDSSAPLRVGTLADASNATTETSVGGLSSSGDLGAEVATRRAPSHHRRTAIAAAAVVLLSVVLFVALRGGRAPTTTDAPPAATAAAMVAPQASPVDTVAPLPEPVPPPPVESVAKTPGKPIVAPAKTKAPAAPPAPSVSSKAAASSAVKKKYVDIK